MTPELLSELKSKVSAAIMSVETALDTLYQAAQDHIASAAADVQSALVAVADDIAPLVDGTAPADAAPVPETAPIDPVDPAAPVLEAPAAEPTTLPDPSTSVDPVPPVDPAANAGTDPVPDSTPVADPVPPAPVDPSVPDGVGGDPTLPPAAAPDPVNSAPEPTPLELAVAKLAALKQHESDDIKADDAAIADAQAAVDALSVPPVA